MYDYIIVGAGSAGCVLANRLTEDPNVSVLLLEAGGPDARQEIHIPITFSKLFKGEEDWAYMTEPEPHLNNRSLYWPRGKVLGGSSSLNAMIYIRGNRHDYDEWQAAGNAGWGYDDVLPYFKKAENQERGASEYHGIGGPLNVADLRSPNELSEAFVAAGEEVGLKRTDDFNGADQEGVGLYQVTQKGGMRYSAAAAYLRDAMTRPNLTVQTGALASRIVIENGRATGVEYTVDGMTTRAEAAAEVILSGGAINSPQLLLLSGIGPAADLQALGIEVTHDLPGVGHNLQDHPAIMAAFVCTQPVSLAAAETAEQMAAFMSEQRGMLTSNVGEGGAFLTTQPESPAPDLQYHFAPSYFIEHGFQVPDGHGFTFAATLVRPQSRGQISLRSTDPTAPAAIHANYLAEEFDMRVLREGIRLARKMAAAEAFAPYRDVESHPGAAVESDADLDEYIRNNAETLYHPVGTCKMGNDDMAVVDDQLRVHGIAGLRVVDASIMPTIINGNTNAPTIMIAEKAADMIRAAAPQPAVAAVA